MIENQLKSKFWDYIVFYPEEDEDGFDGIHYGGIKRIKKNAPEEAKEAFAEYQEILKQAKENGYKA